MKKVMAFLAAAGMAITPVAAAAQDAGALSLTRAGAPLFSGLSFLQDDDDDNEGGGSTAVILGVVLVVLIGIAAVSGGGSEPGPDSP